MNCPIRVFEDRVWDSKRARKVLFDVVEKYFDGSIVESIVESDLGSFLLSMG